MTVTVTGAAVLPTYVRQDVTFVSGEGAWLADAEGRRYLDFVAGIAVVGLGHLHPGPLAAAQAQLGRLWHASNLYWTEPMAELADRLSDRFGGAQAFFCNSGAEAIEAALKYARKATGKPGVVALEGSFHGRTFGALSATGQPAKRRAFEPVVPGIRFAEPNDIVSLSAAADHATGCILLEPVQGEGGIRPLAACVRGGCAGAGGRPRRAPDPRRGADGRRANRLVLLLRAARTSRRTRSRSRRGSANGLPIGALLVADGKAGAFEPGDHGSTFGGNPVASAAAVAVCDTIDDELLAAVRLTGTQLADGLRRLPGVTEVRGRGLLIGAEVDRPAADVVDACRARGLLVGSAGDRTLRLTPPLTIGDAEVEQALAVLGAVLA